MGKFDITDGKHLNIPAPTPGVSMGAETRPGHYLFAHYALRSVALNDPLYYFGVLASPDAPTFLDRLITTVAENARPDDPPPDFSAADCRVYTVRADVHPCAVVKLPSPQAMTEAYFTAAVLLIDPSEEQPDLSNAAVRYFTLELSFGLDGTPLTILCEWKKDGTHCNFGPGPAPDVGLFVSDIARLLNPEQGT